MGWLSEFSKSATGKDYTKPDTLGKAVRGLPQKVSDVEKGLSELLVVGLGIFVVVIGLTLLVIVLTK